MTVYRTGRSTDYHGAEAPPKRVYPLRKIDTTADAIDQFERMAQGMAPRLGEGSVIVWVRDDTLTPELARRCILAGSSARGSCCDPACRSSMRCRAGCREASGCLLTAV